VKNPTEILSGVKQASAGDLADLDPSKPGLEVPYRTQSSDYLRYANASGEIDAFSGTSGTAKPKPGPVSSFDITGDGLTDVVFVNQDQHLAYTNTSAADPVTVTVNGSPVDVDDKGAG
jgi:hypothetical protein